MFQKTITKYRRPAKVGVKILFFIAVILLGAVLGYGSEWLEYGIYYTDHDILNYHNDMLTGLALVLNHFSVWIFTATLISYFSWGPISASVNTFSFFVAMCIAYFIPKHIHYGYTVDLQLLFWIGIAFISIGASILIWFSHAGGWGGTIIKSLSIAAILGEFCYTVYDRINYYKPIPGSPNEPFKWLLQPERILQLSLYLVFMITLVLTLTKGKTERLRVSLSALCFGTVLSAILILAL